MSAALPPGTWIQSAQNYRYQNGILYAELRNNFGQFVPNQIQVMPNRELTNMNGQFVKGALRQQQSMMGGGMSMAQQQQMQMQRIQMQRQQQQINIQKQQMAQQQQVMQQQQTQAMINQQQINNQQLQMQQNQMMSNNIAINSQKQLMAQQQQAPQQQQQQQQNNNNNQSNSRERRGSGSGMGDGRTGFDKLQDMNGVYVKQDMDGFELCGCDFENTYEMFNTNKNGKLKGSCLFKAREESSFCSRNCCRGPARPMKVFIEHVSIGSKDGDPFLELEKPCVCYFPGNCCSRPVVEVFNIENRARDLIGRIKLPCQMCATELEILDAHDNLQYTISGDCMQCGLCCKGMPCDKCQVAHFKLIDDGGANMGFMDKQSKGCCASTLTDADNFVCEFPKTAVKHQRALLLASVIFLDYMFFEQKC